MRKPKKQKQKKPNDKKAAENFSAALLSEIIPKMGKREPKIGSRFLKEDIGKKKN